MNEEKPKKRRFSLPKLTKFDILSIIFLIVFMILVSIPVYTPKGECEIARPGYECASIEEVMIEHCDYWGNYNCETSADISLGQVEWYIQNLCELQNKYHGSGLDCSNLRSACNKISGKQVCSLASGFTFG